MCLATSSNLLLVLQDGKNNNNVFFTRTRDLLVSRKTMQRHFSPHSSSPFPCNFCKRNSNGIFNDSQSWFSFHFYTQRELKPTQKSARKWQLRPFATSCAKYYEGHSPLQTSFTRTSPLEKTWLKKQAHIRFAVDLGLFSRCRVFQSIWDIYKLKRKEVQKARADSTDKGSSSDGTNVTRTQQRTKVAWVTLTSMRVNIRRINSVRGTSSTRMAVSGIYTLHFRHTGGSAETEAIVFKMGHSPLIWN